MGNQKNGILSLLGLAKRGGRLAIGDTQVENAVRRHEAQALLLASDAAEHTVRRGKQLAEAGHCPCLLLSADREELGHALGRSLCAVTALTDIGFAASVAERLAAEDPACKDIAVSLKNRAERSAHRKKAHSLRTKAPVPQSDSGRPDRPAQRFDGKRSDRPDRRFDGKRSDRPDRRYDGKRSDRPDRRYDGKRSDRPDRRFDGKRPDRSDRRFDDKRSDRPSQQFNGKRSDRPDRRFDGKHPSRPDRRFDGRRPGKQTGQRFGSGRPRKHGNKEQS